MPNFKLVFSGICAYVPRKDQDGVLKEVAILMTNGHEKADPNNSRAYTELEVKSRYNTPELKRHRSFLRFAVADQTGVVPPSETIIDLHRKRVSVAAESPGGIPLDGSGMDAAITSGVKQGLFEMSEVLRTMDSSADARVRAECLEKIRPFDAALASQVFLSQGKFSTSSLDGQVWRLELPFDPDYKYRIQPKSEIVCDFSNVTSVTITIEDIASTAKWSMVFKDGTTFQFLNLCDANPLRWPRNANEPEEDDADFLWYYEILDSAAENWVRGKRPMGLLPVPVVNGRPNGNGDNCRPVKFADHEST